MGAWGTGIFENDDVLDWKADLLDSDDIELIEETIVPEGLEWIFT